MFQLVQLPPNPRIVIHDIKANRYFSSTDGFKEAINWLHTSGWCIESGDPTPIIISSLFSDYDDLIQKHPELLI